MAGTIAAGDLPAPPGRPGRVTLRRFGLALRLDLRALALTALALLLLALLLALSLYLGAFRVGLADTARAALGRGDPDHVLIVREVRFPRAVGAALIGAALAVSGAIFQGIVRNPLVSPDMIGIDSGAGLLAVFWIVTGLGVRGMPLAAFAGAILAAAAVYLLAWRGGIAPNRLVLVGIGVGAMLDALTTYLTVRFPIEQARPALVWLIGSLQGSDWADVRVLALFVAVALPLAVALVWPLRAVQLGDDAARTLGLPVEPVRLGLIVVGCALAAVSVAVAGPIGFVALMVPHAARMVAGPLSGGVLLFTGALGACFLVAADLVGQHLLPVSLPVGVVTAAMGAPYFLFLLSRVDARV